MLARRSPATWQRRLARPNKNHAGTLGWVPPFCCREAIREY